MTAAASLDLEFSWKGLTLAGTLHTPRAAGPHPAVVMMQGSGPADRDCDGYFPVIREAFVSRGIAAYAFDKPGCGESDGDWRDYGLMARSDQAEAALATVRRHPAVDGDRIGVWGQSQGGWMAQIIGARRPDLTFAIANSGPSIGVREQNLYGCEHSMRARGIAEDHIDRALEFIEALYQAGRRGADYATVDADLIEPARPAPWYGYVSVDDAADWRFGRILLEEGYEPRETMTRIRCPFLAIFGGRDVLLPAWQSAEDTGRALQDAGNPDATVMVFPTANHRIRDDTTGAYATGYLDLLGAWTAQRVGGTEE